MSGIASAEPWADFPIENAAADEFNRLRFAELVARSIDATPLGGDSRVFGLIGPWGSGKSSVANMVREQLPSSWAVAPFTAWAVPEASTLQLEFTATLSAALGAAEGKGKKIREALSKYSEWALPLLKIIPVAGEAAEALGAKSIAALTERKPWDVQFEQLTQLLGTLETRVLIVCDDIDRLDAVELLEFLKVIRLLGRFPNVHYLVVYDVDTVEELLRAQGISARRSSFMEKIVQHPFELPAVDGATNFRRVAATVEQIAGLHGLRLDEATLKRAGAFVDVLARALRTPRQQIRYHEHLRVYIQLIVSEVDLLDFAAAEYLRLNHHEIFERLPVWAADARNGLKSNESKAGLSRSEWLERIGTSDPQGEAPILFEVLAFLFPQLNDVGPESSHARAFADEEYFERYFNLGVPADDVSDRLVERAIDSLSGLSGADKPAEEELRQVIQSDDLVRARLAIVKSERHRRNPQHPADQAGARRLVEWLAGLVLKTSVGSIESPASVLDAWVGSEVLRAYSDRALGRADVLALFGEDRTLLILLTAQASLRFRPIRDRVLRDFAEFFRNEIDQADSLEPYDRLRLKLSLLIRVEGPEELAGIFDQRVLNDEALFDTLTSVFVRVQRWHSSGPQPSSEDLTFDRDLWETAFSREVREKLVPLLPASPTIADIDIEDTSLENLRNFARAAARDAMERTS